MALVESVERIQTIVKEMELRRAVAVRDMGESTRTQHTASFDYNRGRRDALNGAIIDLRKAVGGGHCQKCQTEGVDKLTRCEKCGRNFCNGCGSHAEHLCWECLDK